MDINSIIAIIIAVAVIYLFIKFIVSPIVKLIAGIVLFLIAIYILQRFFGFNLNNILGPMASYFNSKWGISLGWIINPINYLINKSESFLNYLWGNFAKSLK